MDTVRFSTIGEYLEELAASREDIENEMVRATIQYKTGSAVPLTFISVISTCVVVPSPFSSKHPGSRYLVRLEQSMGSYGESAGRFGKEVLDKTDALIEQIKARCRELGLKCQPGVIEPGKTGDGNG